MTCKLVKLRLEIYDADRLSLLLLYSRLKVSVLRNYSFCSSWRVRYPVSGDSLVSLISCDKLYDRIIIGIRPEKLSPSQFDIYRKILDVEYGVNGVEIRVLRRSLESLAIFLGGKDVS